MGNEEKVEAATAEVVSDIKETAHDEVVMAKTVLEDVKEKAVDAADTAKAVGVGLFDAAKSKAVEIAEKVTNRDLDGDGKVG